MRAEGVHCRESLGDLHVVRVRSLSIQETRLTHFCAPLFSHSHYWYSGHVVRYIQCQRRNIKYTSFRVKTKNACMYVVIRWYRQSVNRKRLYVRNNTAVQASSRCLSLQFSKDVLVEFVRRRDLRQKTVYSNEVTLLPRPGLMSGSEVSPIQQQQTRRLMYMLLYSTEDRFEVCWYNMYILYVCVYSQNFQ